MIHRRPRSPVAQILPFPGGRSTIPARSSPASRAPSSRSRAASTASASRSPPERLGNKLQAIALTRPDVLYEVERLVDELLAAEEPDDELPAAMGLSAAR